MSDNMTSIQHDFNIHPAMKIGYVSLNVSDMDRSVYFYENVLGFKKLARSSNERTLLSVDGHPSYLVELLQSRSKMATTMGTAAEEHSKASISRPRRAGLYHFAVLLPERKYLARMLQNIIKRSDEIQLDGLADHLVSESIYLRDPDNIGIEIYRDRPPSQWEWNGSRVSMATNMLDSAELLRESKASGWNVMPVNTVIGHVHLHVRNLVNSMKFYRKMLGMNLTATYPGAYFFAADKYHHHIATNTWLGTNIELASPVDVIGLNHFSIELPNEEQYEIIAERLKQYRVPAPKYGQSKDSSGSSFLRDMDGISIRLHTR
jgi:catechol 2,3-dioxygenase